MRKTIYDIASMTTIQNIIDARVFKDFTMEDLKKIYRVPASSYINNFIVKHSKTIPPFEGYDPLGRSKVEYLLRDDTLSFKDVAMQLGVTVKGLRAYCSIYNIDIRKLSTDNVNKLRASGLGATDISNYFGYTKGSASTMLSRAADNEVEILNDAQKKSRIKAYEERILQLESQIEVCKKRMEKLKESINEEKEE